MPISHEGVAVIRLCHGAMPKVCPFLFPVDVPGKHVVELKKLWERMRVLADIPEVRILDLRPIFSSSQVSGVASPEVIEQLLGNT